MLGNNGNSMYSWGSHGSVENTGSESRDALAVRGTCRGTFNQPPSLHQTNEYSKRSTNALAWIEMK